MSTLLFLGSRTIHPWFRSNQSREQENTSAALVVPVRTAIILISCNPPRLSNLRVILVTTCHFISLESMLLSFAFTNASRLAAVTTAVYGLVRVPWSVLRGSWVDTASVQILPKTIVPALLPRVMMGSRYRLRTTQSSLPTLLPAITPIDPGIVASFLRLASSRQTPRQTGSCSVPGSCILFLGSSVLRAPKFFTVFFSFWSTLDVKEVLSD